MRNSGIGGGKFLERQRVRRPNSEEAYACRDLYVGGAIWVFGRAFELTGADEYTLTYMNNNQHLFVMADAGAARATLRAQAAGRMPAVRAALGAAAVKAAAAGGAAAEGGLMSDDALEAALAAAGLRLARHQVVALRRRADKERAGGGGNGGAGGAGGGAFDAAELLRLLGLGGEEGAE